MREETRDAAGRWTTALLGSLTLMDVIREIKYDEKYISVIENFTGNRGLLLEAMVVVASLLLFRMYNHPRAGKRPPRFPPK